MLALEGVTSLWAVLGGVNVATLLAYGYDKHAARAGRRRVPEAALHAMAAAGGTPAAVIAQSLLRHKTRDRRFRLVFWAIAAVQVAALLAIAHWRYGMTGN
jgi:uncharacterized membrane protein YsdA (DUF1294 family)